MAEHWIVVPAAWVRLPSVTPKAAFGRFSNANFLTREQDKEQGIGESMESIIQNAAGIFLTIMGVMQFLGLGCKLSDMPEEEKQTYRMKGLIHLNLSIIMFAIGVALLVK